MKKTTVLAFLLTAALTGKAATTIPQDDEVQQKTSIANPYLWADFPDPDIIRVGEYYYLVTTTMHLFPGGPIMRSRDLINWEVVSYLFDSINDTPRYDLKGGSVYGRGQWATSLRYHDGTFWALFVANDDPHKSMVFKTTDPTKGWTLHSRLPAYHDSSLFFDDDGRVYVFSGSGNIHLTELEPDLTAEKEGGVNKNLELHGRPDGLHEGSRVIKHAGMYYLLCISWPKTGRQEICYRSKNIEGPYDSKVILKSDFGGFPLAGQGTVIDGKNGEWYGLIFQDRGGVGRVLTLSPCSWIDGWPMIGNVDDGKIPETITLYTETSTTERTATTDGTLGATVKRDYQWNHNFISEGIHTETGSFTSPGKYVTLTAMEKASSIYEARNTLTWRTYGPTCSDTISIDASKMKDGDCAGLAAFNGDSGILTIKKDGKKVSLIFSEESVRLEQHTKTIASVDRKEVERIAIPSSKLKDIRLAMNCDFNVGKDIATFAYSIDNGMTWKSIGREYKMKYDFMRFFMGTRYALFYYPTKDLGGKVNVRLRNE